MNIVHFLTKVAIGTDSGKIDWHEGEREDSYSVEVANSVLHVWKWTDEDSGLVGYTFSVHKNGEFVDSIYGDKYDENFTKLENMFNSARRVALRVNASLDNIAAELESKFGF